MFALLLVLLAALAAGAPSSAAGAQSHKQHAVVIFDHRAGNIPRITSEVDSKMTRGGLNQVRVPTGEAACFVVERANTLLYGYSMNPEALKGQTSAEASDIVTSLATSLAGKAVSKATQVALAGETAAGEKLPQLKLAFQNLRANPESYVNFSQGTVDPFESAAMRGIEASSRARIEPYVQVISSITRAAAETDNGNARADAYSGDLKRLSGIVAEMEALRKKSPADTNLSFTVDRATTLLADARKRADEMTTAYDEETASYFDVFRETQKSLVAQANKLQEEYATAKKNDRLEFCHTLQDARVRLRLVVAPKTATGNGAVKPDTVASFVAEPENEKNFEIVPAIVASFAISGEKSFEVEGSSIRAAETRPKFAPSAFMMWRVAERKPFWAAVGTAPGRGKLPDAHLGFVVRLGEEKLKTNLVLGGGLAFAHTPMGLNGASVGSALPEGKSLVDVTRFGYRWGPTVFLTISGLSIPVGEGTPAASPDARP